MATSDRGCLPVPGLLTSDGLFGEDEQDTALLRRMAGQATEYLLSFPWCTSVRESYFAEGIGGIFAVFLLRIVPGKPGIPDWLWVLIGDVPSAYLPVDDAKKASDALGQYLRASHAWVELAKQGRSDLAGIPFDVPSTPEWAKKLDIRLKMIEELVLPKIVAAEVQQTKPF